MSEMQGPPTGRIGPTRPPHDFEQAYKGNPPWDIGRPQPAFVELAQAGALRGRVLDVGCGTGEHALMAAELGLHVTGIDVAAAAIARADEKARRRGLEARFLVGDALELAGLGEVFDTVLDCGLFHVFDDDDRRRYIDSLSAATSSGGRYFMLCFSDAEPGDWGPRRITRAEIESSVRDGWHIDSIDPSRMEINIDPAGAQAWRVSATRT